jgi:hypothetical protein
LEGAFILPGAGKVYKFELLIAGLPTQQQQAQGETFPERKISQRASGERCVTLLDSFFFQKHFFLFLKT